MTAKEVLVITVLNRLNPRRVTESYSNFSCSFPIITNSSSLNKENLNRDNVWISDLN